MNKRFTCGHKPGRGALREVRKMSLNRVTIIGHLGQDPELRYLPTSGQAVTGFSVATDESFTGKDGNRQERVEWHNVVVFGKLAETCAKYLAKGRQIYVEGRLRFPPAIGAPRKGRTAALPAAVLGA